VTTEFCTKCNTTYYDQALSTTAVNITDNGQQKLESNNTFTTVYGDYATDTVCLSQNDVETCIENFEIFLIKN
jgi:archaellum component FlaF (FlaF/FlaG flagellin family)